MSATTVNSSHVATEHQAAARLALAGAGCGLAWSCALRGWMMAVAGPESTVTWAGTFGGIADVTRRSDPPTRPLSATYRSAPGVLARGRDWPAVERADPAGARGRQ